MKLNNEHLNPFIADSYVKPFHSYYEIVEAKKLKYGVRSTTLEEEKAIVKQLNENYKYGGCV